MLAKLAKFRFFRHFCRCEVGQLDQLHPFLLRLREGEVPPRAVFLITTYSKLLARRFGALSHLFRSAIIPPPRNLMSKFTRVRPTSINFALSRLAFIFNSRKAKSPEGSRKYERAKKWSLFCECLLTPDRLNHTHNANNEPPQLPRRRCKRKCCVKFIPNFQRSKSLYSMTKPGPNRVLFPGEPGGVNPRILCR